MSGRHFAPPEQQPASFVFTDSLRQKADATIAKYPDDRKASAVIPLLDLAQRQEGWVSLKAIEHIAGKLDMAPIRVQEVASFYFMFNLAPIGKHHIQVCGTTPCWLRGTDQVYEAIREVCGIGVGETSGDGMFTVTEVECLGACVNAPMVQIDDDYYEDLDKENFGEVLRALRDGRDPKANSQTGRTSSEPAGGTTTLKDCNFEEIIAWGRKRRIGPDEEDTEEAAEESGHGGVEEAEPELPVGDKSAGADGGEPEGGDADSGKPDSSTADADEPASAETTGAEAKGAEADADAEEGDGTEDQGDGDEETGSAAPDGPTVATAEPVIAVAPTLADPNRPPELTTARDGVADDLKRIKGIGPKIEQTLNGLGIWHFDQIAAWSEEQKLWVNGYLQFSGRIDREGWIEQARDLAAQKSRNGTGGEG